MYKVKQINNDKVYNDKFLYNDNLYGPHRNPMRTKAK